MNSFPTRDGRQAFLFFSHLDSWLLKHQFERLKAATAAYGDLFWIMDCTGGRQNASEDGRMVPFTIDEVNALSPTFQLESTFPGNGHLPTILFAEGHPRYQYFWVIEYDVRFSGDWATFFDRFVDVDADLLTTHLRSYADDPEWELWELSSPTASVPLADRHATFTPLFRISRRALRFILRAHREGWKGHYEVLLPTLLRRNGYEVRDLNEFGPWYRPEQFRWRPPMWTAGHTADELYHPIKPPSWMVKEGLRGARSWLRETGSRWNLRSFLPRRG